MVPGASQRTGSFLHINSLNIFASLKSLGSLIGGGLTPLAPCSLDNKRVNKKNQKKKKKTKIVVD